MAANVKSTRRSPLMDRNVRPRLLGLRSGALILLALAGCTRAAKGPDEMQWARAALERNERLEVVASDPQGRTFSVRVKDSGQLRIVPLNQLVAGPPEALEPAGASGPMSEAPVAGTSGATEAVGSTDASGAAAAGGTNPAGAAATPPATAANTETDENSGRSSGDAAGVRNAGVSGSADAANSSVASAGESARPATSDVASTAGAVTPRSETAADARPGRILASGPGYSIKATGVRGNATRAASVARGLADGASA